MRDFVVYDFFWKSAANRKEKELQEFAMEFYGKLLTGQYGPSMLHALIATKVRELNERYPRGKALQTSFVRSKNKYTETVQISVYPDGSYESTPTIRLSMVGVAGEISSEELERRRDSLEEGGRHV